MQERCSLLWTGPHQPFAKVKIVREGYFVNLSCLAARFLYGYGNWKEDFPERERALVFTKFAILKKHDLDSVFI